MVLKRDLSKIIKDFEEKSKDFSDLKVSIELKETDFIQNSKSKFSKPFVIETQIKSYELKKDKKLEISGKGNLCLDVRESCRLNLEVLENSAIRVILRVAEDVKFMLINVLDKNNSFLFIEIFLSENSKVEHSELIKGSGVLITESFLEKNSKYNLTAAYSATSNLLVYSASNHLGERSSSNMSIKGVADNSSKVINDGFIFIDQKAFLSLGHQSLKNIILDKNSSISSEPILEIDNNNVKCSHGASISQVSDNVKFYMQSRGLSRKELTNLIVESFFEEVRNL